MAGNLGLVIMQCIVYKLAMAEIFTWLSPLRDTDADVGSARGRLWKLICSRSRLIEIGGWFIFGDQPLT